MLLYLVECIAYCFVLVRINKLIIIIFENICKFVKRHKVVTSEALAAVGCV